MVPRRLAGLALCLGLLAPALVPATTPARAATEATAIVERLNGALLEVMRNADRLGYQGRFDTLAPVLVETFNFPAMAQISLGRHWGNLDDAQKKQMAQVFARLSVATFAARFDSFGGEVFQVLGEVEQRNKTILVKNRLVKRSGDAVSLNYVLRPFGGELRIIDVYLDAKYSELALKRSEYSSVMKQSGFPGLIAAMEDKIHYYASEG